MFTSFNEKNYYNKFHLNTYDNVSLFYETIDKCNFDALENTFLSN